MKICLVFRYAIDDEIRQQIESGNHPRADFLDLADRLEAEVIDFTRVKASRLPMVIAARWFGLTAASAVLAWARRGEFDVFYISSETTGIVFCGLLKFSTRRPKTAILNHYLSHKWKSRFVRWFDLTSAMDAIICMNEFQTNFARTTLCIEPKKVVQVQYGAMVDGRFFTPDRRCQSDNTYVLSVGRERRDYEFLLGALRTLDVPATIVASGLGSANGYSNSALRSQHKVTVLSNLSYTNLRDVYADSAFVVLPLHDVEFPAGVTTIMEAMAMGKAVIATRSRGIHEFIEDGRSGLWVNIGDVEDLRAKIIYLWNNPDIAHRMGVYARTLVKERVDLTRSVGELASILVDLNKDATRH